ncbi:hypothetical protein GPECTOR_10g926 [Gonium pectorale]|uniref:Uncharacterized protein n=1 Tax=Gonium pectorale TaxID=33097 RepID=A0A150GR71_GONPE|nr:hypothetical protein GPECTOR_10g926 [Gonium pectorale]|eukprot:KXZ52294.1 hypothetical protein GPECTOR_10g926 [Gonium pectorale]
MPDEQKGVVVYELEPLTSPSAANPDWGFKAAAAVRAKAASSVVHLALPPDPGPIAAAAAAGINGTAGGGVAATAAGNATLAVVKAAPLHALAVADYGAGEVVLYGMHSSERRAASVHGGNAGGSGPAGSGSGSGGLAVSELQRLALPGVASLARCRWGEQLFLVALAFHHDKSYATTSAVYRWDSAAQQFTLLQELATSGAHGGRCFTLRDGAAPASGSAGGPPSPAAGSGDGAEGQSLFLAIANSRGAQGDGFAANSTVWRFDPDAGRFLLHQAVPTVGAHDVQHVRLPAHGLRRAGGRRSGGGGAGGRGGLVDVLVFANRGADEECSPSERSPLLVWHPRRQRWEEAAHMGLSCATGLATTRLGTQQLLLATGDRAANGSYAGPLTHLWRLEAEGLAAGVGAGEGAGSEGVRRDKV